MTFGQELDKGKGAPLFRVAASPVALISPGDSFIRNIRFLYPWNSPTVVTAVPAGEQFDFIVDYRCINTAGNIVDPWSMCIVFWDDEKDIKGWYFRNSTFSLAPTIIDDNSARIANAYNLIMPTHNVVLHFNMFANNDNTPAQEYPDESVWATLR